jgi:putative FmdB family regulatory protein
MPLYEYKCESCGKTFEVIQKFSDTPLEVHADCGGKVIRLVSPSALHFKGSGWYVTDYASSKNGADKGKSKDAKDAKDTKKETTRSTDSSAKTETKSSSSTPASSSDKSDKKV